MGISSKILWFILMLGAGALAVCGIGMGVGGVILFTVPFGFISAHIFAGKFLGPWIGNEIAFGIYYPAKNVKPPPPEFPVIRAKIANEKYEEAVIHAANTCLVKRHLRDEVIFNTVVKREA